MLLPWILWPKPERLLFHDYMDIHEAGYLKRRLHLLDALGWTPHPVKGLVCQVHDTLEIRALGIVVGGRVAAKLGVLYPASWFRATD